MARKPGPSHSLSGGDWIPSTHDVNDGSFTSDGRTKLPMMKSYVEPVSFQLHLLSANEGLDCLDTLRDSPMMFQQTRSSRPAAKFKTVSGHHPTGGVLEVDLSLHGSIRSAGTRNTGDWCSRAGRGQIVLATNRNGGMLRLIAPRHVDDDDVYASTGCWTSYLTTVPILVM